MINGLSLGAILRTDRTRLYNGLRYHKTDQFRPRDIMMVGAFVGYFSLTLFGTNIIVAMVFSMLVCAVLGVLIEKIAYRPLRNSTRIAALITAIGVSLFLEYATIFILGRPRKYFPKPHLK
jgi:branched-chain amino acid transport system permease protein